MPNAAHPLPILAADIGGTNTRVALLDGLALRQDTLRRYPNAGAANLGEILARYLNEMGGPALGGASVAAAGPVRGGVAEMTNLDWRITASDLAAVTGTARIAILNDLQAQGHALGHIADAHLRRVVAGRNEPGAARLVVGLGTGMNAAPVHDLPGGGRFVAPAECGHAGMPVPDAELYALSRYIATKGAGAHGFAGVEDVLAGRALPRIHAFVTGSDHSDLSPAEVIKAIAAGDHHARAVAAIYVRALGHVLGDLALNHLPFGGIFLIGGVARAMQPWFDEMGLAAHFRAKGRFADFMTGFSVTVVEDDYAALTGCAAHLG
jgi:glucokinase